MIKDEHKEMSGGSSPQAMIERLFKAPTVRHGLDNGLMLLHRPDFSSEVVSVQVWVKTGSIHEDALIGSGLSHFLEHMLFKGTERRDGKAISREVHAMGGAINAYTTFDRTVYYIDAPAAACAQAIDLLADIVLHSKLPEAEVERERSVILREIDMGLDDPDRQLSQALFRTAFQRHPYREPVIGHRALFEQVTAAELSAYYGARYVPNNMVLSVVGAVRTEDCIAMVDKTLGAVPRGRLAPVRIEAEPVQLAARREDIRGDYNVFRGGLGFKVPHLSHPDAPRLDALAHALGGGESSLLWERLRNEAKIVHYIDCRNWSPGDTGLLWISYVCDPGREREVEATILECIEGVATEGLPESVVEKARRQALSGEINGRKTMSGQASRLGLGEVVIGDVLYGRRYLQRLQTIEAGDLKTVAARYLVAEGMSSVTLGPESGAAGERASGGAAAQLAPFETLHDERGARLLLQADHRLPKVHFRAVFLGGPLSEPRGQRGISALLAELLTKDTAQRSAQSIAETVERVGGSFTAAAGNNTISLALEVLPSDLSLAVSLLSEAFSSPAFAPSTVATEREAQVAGLKESDDEILEYGLRRLRERFFGRHPFAIGPDGRIEDVERIDAKGLRAYYQRIVRADNLVLAVTGDFQREALLEALEGLLESGLPSSPPASPDPDAGQPTHSPETGPEQPYRGHESMAREQTVVLRGYPDAGVQEDDFVVGEVLNELFSGMSSRLFERVREDQGMAYYVGATRVIGLRGGMFVFYAGTHPSQAEAVLAEIDAEIARVASGGVTEAELERCRTRLKAARPMGKQTLGARAMHAAIQLSYGLPMEDDAAYGVRIDAVDGGALARFVAERFTTDREVQLTVGPQADTAPRDQPGPQGD
jgi:zinc protease